MYIILKYGDLGDGINTFSMPLGFADSKEIFSYYIDKLVKNNHVVIDNITEENEFGIGSESIMVKDVASNQPAYHLVCMPVEPIAYIANNLKRKNLFGNTEN